ncbi:MAG: tetratricopeptide repeat protein [Alphaproteobacteria bacterium]|nr:tetratricopeptide repeat protein [Alphaproteobacteria bacterium]
MWLAGLILVACGQAPAPTPPVEVPAGYVGSAACVRCHADEVARWQASHHALALTPPTGLQGAWDGAVAAGSDRVELGAAPAPHARVHTADGVVEAPVAWVLGRDPVQQPVVRWARGALQALPVGLEVATGAWLDLVPDDAGHGGVGGPAWNADHQCLDCHTTGFEKGWDAAAGTHASTWAEAAVGCEGCHGPGAAHVAAGGQGGLDADVPAADPARWTPPDAATGIAGRADGGSGPHPQVEACGRCHARRALLVARSDQQPDRALVTTHRPTLIEPGLHLPDGRMQEEVFSWAPFRRSRMHEAGVACTDCHDPHAGGLRAPGEATCARCHDTARFADVEHTHHPVGAAGCIDCHMPVRTYLARDVRHDHGFEVPRPARDLALGLPSACTTACHDDRDAAWAAEATSGWRLARRRWDDAWTEALAGAWAGRPDGDALGAVVADRLLPGLVRASAAVALGERTEAQAGTVLAAAADPDPLVRFGAVRALGRLPPQVAAPALAERLDDGARAVRFEAAALLRDLGGSQRPELAGRLAPVVAELRAQARRDGDRAEGLLLEGTLAWQDGAPEVAEAAYRQALDRDPELVAAWVDLADVLRAQGREAEALRTLDEGLGRHPEAAVLHHARGLALVRAGRKSEALDALRRAVELDPGEVRHAYVLAIALHDQGQPAAAREVLDAARARHPASEALRALRTSLDRPGPAE